MCENDFVAGNARQAGIDNAVDDCCCEEDGDDMAWG